MRKSVLLALVSVLALVASMVLVAPAAQASTAMPVWTAGDYWIYGTNSITQYLGTGYTGSATLRYDVIGPESIAIGGTSVSTIKIKVNLTISASAGSFAVTFWENGFQWYRASDLANAQQSLSVKIGTNWLNQTLTYNPPPDIHWPLTPGSSWQTNTNVTTVVNSGTPSTYAEVVNQTVLTETHLNVGAAGNFTVDPLKVLEGFSSTYTVYYWSGTVGNYVSIRDFYVSNNTQRDSMDLKSYSYGGALNSLFLGLSILLWIVILVIVAVVIVAAVFLLRRKPAAPPPMQPGMPPYQPPAYPPQQPPQQPPQGPMGPPPSP